MSFILIIEDASGIRQFRPSGPVISIGRSTDNNLQLTDERISRHHAQIELLENKPLLTDLGSANGTVLNGTELEPRIPVSLKHGDQIQISSFSITLSTEETGQQISSAAQPGIKVGSSRPSSLLVTTQSGTTEFSLTGKSITLGRSKENDIVIDDASVSRAHARIDKTPQGYVIYDLNSTNGLTFQSNLITSKLLEADDEIWIAGKISFKYITLQEKPVIKEQPVVTPESATQRVATTELRIPAHEEKVEQLAVKGYTSLTIGRSPDNDMVLSHPTISRKHARVYRVGDDGTYMIEDAGSTHGTFVNGVKISAATTLTRGDIINIGPIKLVFTPETISKTDQSRNLRVDAVHLNQRVGKNVNLLQDLSLTIEPNEFVAIVGGSGAGKSTLLKALIGFNPASDGNVLINGDDLYRNFEAHRSQFGFVPQEDIIHRELTVYEALDYSARLRLPADTSSADRHKRIIVSCYAGPHRAQRPSNKKTQRRPAKTRFHWRGATHTARSFLP
jgi:pSer/pThr/pTyr-binding forkhead associated (FHA) protein